MVSVLIFFSGCSTTAENQQPTQSTAAFYPVGTEISADLNGDGKAEKIYYGMDDFRVNDISYKELIEYAVYENNPLEDNYILVDLDAADSQTEIALLSNGPSDDPEISFYTYYSDSLIEVGSIPTAVDDLSAAFDGKGTVKGNLRLSILQTWWAPAQWQINADYTISLKEQALYYPISYENAEPITLKVSLPIYKNIGDTNATAELNPQEVAVTATDNKSWCYIEAKDGTKGWFRIEAFSWISDKELDATAVFDHLCMAD